MSTSGKKGNGKEVGAAVHLRKKEERVKNLLMGRTSIASITN